MQLRDEKEMDNLSKLYLTEVIRRECWDDMLIKGRGLVVSESQCLFLLVNQCKSLDDCWHLRASIWTAMLFLESDQDLGTL